MSELAFDGNGEPITFPAEAEELRIRCFRNPGMRGACEVVHDADGAPLYVSVDITYLEFRRLVGGVPGRYRGDPVDAERRLIPNSVPAYVTITEPVRNGGSVGYADDRDSVIRELARANAEMTTTIADRFASVMAAAADLLRAADGAGMPRRESAVPMPIESVREAHDPIDDDDDDDDQGDEETSPDIVSLIAELLPTIQMWLAARAAEKTAAAQKAAAPAPEPVQSPVPAPRVGKAEGDREAGAAAGPADGPPGPSDHEGRDVDGQGLMSDAATAEVMPSATDASVRNADRAWSPGEIERLRAIYQELSREERRIAQVVVARMPPDLRTRWLAELLAMTVEEAVGLVRSMIPGHRRRKESDS